MKQFRLVDNILGWVAFLIAAVVYCSTIEPTASFWDCPEFISTGYKLEVGHPPGAPFFMLTANLFSQLASDPSEVARMVNTMSALLSATCIMFLFWSITHLTRKLIFSPEDKTVGMPLSKLIAIEASGMVGALIYTFSDTFWFSAVEGEVYAYSSAFTAVVFWLILKWEDCADEPHSDRWLVLIAYMTGLSIGVHLLNLLCIPAIVLVYYYKKNPNADLKGSLIALALSFVLIAAVLYGVVPGILKVAGCFEWVFVNWLGFSFNTGLFIYMIMLIGIVVWAIYESYHHRSVTRENISFVLSIGMLGAPFFGFGLNAGITGFFILCIIFGALYYKRNGVAVITARVKNTTLLCMLMLMIGYSTYAVIVIRSSSNPPMDQNSPEDVFTLGDYLARDQYGDSPLIYGETYNSQVKLKVVGDRCIPETKEGAPIIQRVEKHDANEPDRYFVLRTKDKYVYEHKMLFPRMHDAAHAQMYEDWMGGVDCNVKQYDRCGEIVDVRIPTFAENIRFFLSYQCNFMYWRYFMWNFAGRQNDLQGNGELEHGNWITGIPFIDNAMLGDQSLLPDDLKENKGHNVFFCLPLLLGLIGLFWQSFRGEKGIQQFWVVFFLFFMTGLAIVLYLNQTPGQPRERDYAYAGSFYAFAIWCGMGVAAILDIIERKLKKDNVAIAAAISVVCLLVPIQMASQTWDDHDRSGRYTCRDFGQNYLMSLQENCNPIIFTNGDNDTFPLWYNQDVEGVATDARVCNLSYLQTDWYIDQMVRPAYDSPSLPITWQRIDYCSGTNDYISVNPELKDQIKKFYESNPIEARQLYGENPFEVKNVLKYWVREGKDEDDTHVIPTDTLYLTVDKEAVKKSGMMMATDSIPDHMVISLAGKRALYKGDLMLLEMLANANWTRPLYVALTVGRENYMNLGNNFVQEGLVNRITPFTTQDENGQTIPGARSFDTERTYKNVMTRFKFGGLDKPGLYLDETVMRMCYTHKRLFGELAKQLISEGKKDKARKALEYMNKVMPEYNVPTTYQSGGFDIVDCYTKLGMKKEAMQAISKMWKNCAQYMSWYLNLNSGRFAQSQRECYTQIYIMEHLCMLAEKVDHGKSEAMYKQLMDIVTRYQNRGGMLPED